MKQYRIFNVAVFNNFFSAEGEGMHDVKVKIILSRNGAKAQRKLALIGNTCIQHLSDLNLESFKSFRKQLSKCEIPCLLGRQGYFEGLTDGRFFGFQDLIYPVSPTDRGFNYRLITSFIYFFKIPKANLSSCHKTKFII